MPCGAAFLCVFAYVVCPSAWVLRAFAGIKRICCRSRVLGFFREARVHPISVKVRRLGVGGREVDGSVVHLVVVCVRCVKAGGWGSPALAGHIFCCRLIKRPFLPGRGLRVASNGLASHVVRPPWYDCIPRGPVCCG